MKKQVIRCSQKDYDFYTIPFPLKAIKKDYRTKYLYSELGKVHPCFSDDCCFDYHLRLEKSGLRADVVVMQKFKLAEIKTRNKQIYVKESKNQPYFVSDKSLKKKLIIIYSIFIVSLLVIINRKITLRKAFIEKQPMNITIENSLTGTDDSKTGNASAIDVNELFSTLKEQEAIVKNLEWKTDGFNEQLSLTISGVYPEQLSLSSKNIIFSPVVFENKNPFMTISIKEKSTLSGDFIAADSSYCRTEFRNLISELNGVITEETVNPFGIKFSIRAKNNDYERTEDSVRTALVKVFKFICDKDLSVETLSISSSKDGVNLWFSFSNVSLNSSKELCNAVLESTSLFFEETKETPVQKFSPEKTIVNQKKVGQFILENGSVVEFFKDEKGKIIKREN